MCVTGGNLIETENADRAATGDGKCREVKRVERAYEHWKNYTTIVLAQI